MADNRIDYDYISGKLKSETGAHFDAMRVFLDNANAEVADMGWSGSSANFYIDTIDELKVKITNIQEGFNAKLDTDYTTIINEYSTAESDSESQTKTIEL